ncbi:unnamed protein product [Arabis nemorensis]|uniref:Mitochondrial import inner membrane translocase subunit TIM50 n=1 Tax=Arabis nemorensis TaxID=586526 RepID=A0A565BNC5_9BRAS|nr:unnamed protein product [Arabis nemorensis]
MVELTLADLVYSPRWSLQLWNVLVNWLDFFYQLILRAFAHNPLLYTSSSTKAIADVFKPLSVIELPEIAAESPVAVEIASEGEVSSIQRLTVVLDLDETLVSAYETSSLSAALLFERPGLHEFLEQLSQFAHLILFTAGLEDYARPLVDRIDAKNVFRDRLYRPSTVGTVVIVDNNPYSFVLQPLNGIPCVPFSAEQPNDTQLLDIIHPLLKQVSEVEDVRPALYERFHMPEWFEKHGIPRSCWTSSQLPEPK